MTGFQSKKAAANEKITVETDLQMIMLQALKDLNLKVEALRSRVEQLEWKARDDGK